ncbi:MAG TPA: metalloregulator ArsR/SmtB family transcription factor [Tepidisphaeraceae bacterium]|nr:metalloregulator ArsR/SmtB family transcription factor [Tepidisphaeraceae bacterium]
MRHPPSIPGASGNGGGDFYDVAAELLSHLADANRLRILAALAGGELNVGTLCERIGRPQPSVSYHLSILRRTGMVKTRKSGKAVYYDLASSPGQNAVCVRVAGVAVTVSAVANHDGANIFHRPRSGESGR